MHKLTFRFAGAALVLPVLLGGCGKFQLGGKSHSAELPTPHQLKEVRYMSQAPGPDGRRYFTHLEQAKSCHDLEIAMRWNRPPDVKGGPFDAKMVYVASKFPADLPRHSEVFVSGAIERGQTLPSGGSVWSLKLKDGSEIQAIETAGYAQKQEEAQQGGGHATMIHPYTHGRMLCAYGVYQGNTGTSLDQHQRVPLVSILFAMDRRR